MKKKKKKNNIKIETLNLKIEIGIESHFGKKKGGNLNTTGTISWKMMQTGINGSH
jgi:hypothetical protein